MNLTDDEILKFQRGSPVFIDDICAVYPAKLGEIVDLGYSKFQQYLSILTASKPDGQDKEMQEMLDKLSDLQYILLIASTDPEINTLLKQSFQFFTHENIIFSLDAAQIIIGPVEEQHIMNEQKFDEFKRLLKHMYFLEEGDDIIINPDDPPAVVKLKKTMLKNREKLCRAKAKEARKQKSNLEFSDLIGSLTINHCNLNMENIWNITYYAFHDQLKRMGWRDQFDINNRAAMAGAKINKNQLKHWMRSIADSDKS